MGQSGESEAALVVSGMMRRWWSEWGARSETGDELLGLELQAFGESGDGDLRYAERFGDL